MFQKLLLQFFAFLIPLHALIITIMQCKFGFDVSFFRFWKEIIIIGLFVFVVGKTLKKYKGNLSIIYKDNNILGLTTTFGICTFIFIFFPFFNPSTASFLGFRYDMFFFLALIIGMYLGVNKETFRSVLKSIFISTGLILIIFLPWFLSGNISAMVDVFGYSPNVSTYNAGDCLTFSQNSAGHHRFQGSFGDPIRFSVFLTIMIILFYGFIYDFTNFSEKKKRNIFVISAIIVLISVLLSLSKTSVLGAVFATGLMIYMNFFWKQKNEKIKKITQKIKKWHIYTVIALVFSGIVGLFATDKFLHLGSIINRFDNLKISLEMFTHNPFGHGLGIAGPASQLGTTIESAGSWQIAVIDTNNIHKFLPENWYVQILLEQGLIGFSFFVALIIVLGVALYNSIKKSPTKIGISIFVAYLSLCFMANFTHAFEESATSYVLFMIIGMYLSFGNYNYNK